MAEAASVAIAVLSRYPEAGRVKTRLQPLLGPEGCRRLQEALLLDTVDRLQAFPHPLFLFLDGGDTRQRTRLKARLPERVVLRPQSDGDLGERMLEAARHSSAAARGVILLGTDAPLLPMATIRSALETIQRGVTVLCPVDDGGYCLLGIEQPEPQLFRGIDWGTDQVLRQSLKRLEGRRYQLLAPCYDIDVEKDLRRLAADLQQTCEGYPLRTARLLQELGWLRTDAPGNETAPPGV